MKKQIITLSVVGVVLLAIIGVLVFVLVWEPGGEEEETPSAVETTTTSLWSYEAGEMTSLEVVNNADGHEYTIERVDEETLELAMYSGLPRNESAYTSAARFASFATLNTVNEAPEDYSVYGLDSPQLIITGHFEDGETKTLLIGDESPQASAVYARVEGEPEVYIVSENNVSTFRFDTTHFIDKMIAPTHEDPTGYSIFTIEYGGAVREEPVVVQKISEEDSVSGITINSGYSIVQPEVIETNMNMIEDILNGALEMEGNGIAAVHPSDDELAAFGLAEPYSTIEVTYSVLEEATDDEEEEAEESHSSVIQDALYDVFKILVGDEDGEGNRYVMLEGRPIIYTVDAESILWLDYQYTDISTRLMFTAYINDVSRILVTAGEEVYDFTLELEVIPAEDEDGKDEENLYVYCNGQELDVSSFRKLYQLILYSSGENVAENVPDAEPVLEYVFSYVDTSRPDDILRFIPVDNRTVALEYNGLTIYTLRNAYVTKVLESIQVVLDGETLVGTDW